MKYIKKFESDQNLLNKIKDYKDKYLNKFIVYTEKKRYYIGKISSVRYFQAGNCFLLESQTYIKNSDGDYVVFYTFNMYSDNEDINIINIFNNLKDAIDFRESIGKYNI